MIKLTQFLLIMPLTIAFAGCGGNGLPMVPVSGKITFDGGECPAAGRVIFVPIETTSGLTSRSGNGTFSKDGSFRVTSFEENDGLLPGTYEVNISCRKGPPNPRDKNPLQAASWIDPSYQPEQIVVEENSDEVVLKLDVPKKTT